MKIVLMNLLLVYVAIVLGASGFPAKLTSDTDKTYTITIEQNSEQKIIINNTVELKPGPFDIVLELSEPMGLIINASFSKKTFKLALKNKHLDKLPGFQETGMSEGFFNEDKEIFISDNAPNYWYYDTENENRFNSFEKVGKSIICKRTIENLYEPRTSTSIKTIDNTKPIYLVFMSYKRGNKVTDRIEVQREYLKIKWIK